MEVSGKLIENLQLDLAELNGYIADSKRTNIKLQLEMIRTTLSKQLEDEKKKQEVLKTTLEQPKQVIKSEPVYLSITKYAFENSKDVVK
jgi:predicted RNase H-like nuclease (RuvC/YqgF family)